MKAEDLMVGDVIRCPGYPNVKKPARMQVIKDKELMDDDENHLNGLVIELSSARQMFPKYMLFNEPLGGSFWAVERNGQQIWPEAQP